MAEIPKFTLFGEGDTEIEEMLQPSLGLRGWSDLRLDEKKIALQQIENRGWVHDHSAEVMNAILYLNNAFLRQCPGENLHRIVPDRGSGRSANNESSIRRAAYEDFCIIFLSTPSESMVFRMLSKLASEFIDNWAYKRAKTEKGDEDRLRAINEAFEKFDRLANCLNHIFVQFSVNQIVTRSGFVPLQESKVSEYIYVPTLRALSDPKWGPVSTDISEMFDDFRSGEYPETVTKAHRAIQRFLQISVGEEGKGGKGEVGKLFAKARKDGVIPVTRFTEPILNVLQSYIPAERASKSTAKPAVEPTSQSDALLMMNVVMILLQYCLQEGR